MTVGLTYCHDCSLRTARPTRGATSYVGRNAALPAAASELSVQQHLREHLSGPGTKFRGGRSTVLDIPSGGL
jgi:hypothetical protein